MAWQSQFHGVRWQARAPVLHRRNLVEYLGEINLQRLFSKRWQLSKTKRPCARVYHSVESSVFDTKKRNAYTFSVFYNLQRR